jgi:ABC-2 type transport system permease protein
MNWLPKGSTLWLVAHELRLSFRGRAAAPRSGMVLIGILGALAFAIGLILAVEMRNVHIPIKPFTALIFDLVLLAILSLMLSVTVSRAAQIFFERGDLELLLSSPIPGRRVLTARCVGMALSASLTFLLLVTPFVVSSALLGRSEWLWAYGVLASAAFLSTAVGLVISMGLFALIGPRAAKTLAQILSAIIGASFYLLSQMGRYLDLGPSTRDPGFWRDTMSDLLRTGLFEPGQPLAWPLQAVTGEPGPASAIIAIALSIFLVVTTGLGARFERDAAAAAGVGAGGSGKSTRTRRFSEGPFTAMLRKELTLFRRDIALIAQVLLRLLYLVPTGFVLVKGVGTGGDITGPAIAGLLTFVSAQVASSLAWIAMSGEEGLELLAASPAPAPLLRRAKLAAVLVPVSCLMIIPLGLTAWLSPQAGAAALLGVVAGAVSAGLIAIWYEVPTLRTQFRKRSSGSWIGGLADMLISTLWASAAALAAGAWWPLALFPALLAIGALFAAQRPQKTYTETLPSA